MKKKILIVSGDPNSINSEIIFKAWKKLNKVEKKKIYLISNSNLLKKQEGDYLDAMFSYALQLDRRDQKFQNDHKKSIEGCKNCT